jgi:hypothetical protein
VEEMLDSERGAPRPLSALLSQILVAYTVELDDDFELGMSRAGFPGARLSLVAWTNLIRFIPEGGTSVRDLQTVSFGSDDRLKLQLGCLERWGFVYFQREGSGNHEPHARPGVRRDGWGSGRGIKMTWIVHLARRGRLAAGIWSTMWPEVEKRWRQRFGADYASLYDALREVERRRDVELPLGLPGVGNFPWSETYQPRNSQKDEADLPLSALLSRVLLMFTIEFNRRSRVPISACANTIRVLRPDAGTRLGDLPRLTGCSPETSDIGWFLKRFVAVEPDPSGKRGKLVMLSPAGQEAQRTYYLLTRDIEDEWKLKFGAAAVRRLRASLEEVLAQRRDGKSVIGLGMVPPDGTVRAGSAAPALGRRDVGAAAKQRGHDSVEQTKLFVADPEGSLPHYPMWDMNRGFGP